MTDKQKDDEDHARAEETERPDDAPDGYSLVFKELTPDDLTPEADSSKNDGD